MNTSYRELVESLDEIMNEEESTEEVLSPQELLKDIVHSLKSCIDSLAMNEEGDCEKLISDLKKVRDILSESGYDSTSDAEQVVEEDSDCCYGTEDMGPTDKDGVQGYGDMDGVSYAAREGFVGI